MGRPAHDAQQLARAVRKQVLEIAYSDSESLDPKQKSKLMGSLRQLSNAVETFESMLKYCAVKTVRPLADLPQAIRACRQTITGGNFPAKLFSAAELGAIEKALGDLETLLQQLSIDIIRG